MSGRGPIWALCPAKSFAHAKSRLAGVLGAGARAAFAREMLEHVLGVLGGCAEIDGVMVVTNGDDVADLSRAKGAVVARDAADPPLGAIIDAALEELSTRGAGGALVLMSDLPLLDAADVARLVDMMQWHDVVAVPDLRGAGTNALGISPPLRMRTSFGTRDSFDRHLYAARAAGLRVGIHRSAGLALDVDEPEDLSRLSGSAMRAQTG